MIYGSTSNDVYLQKKSLCYCPMGGTAQCKWMSLHKDIPKILGYSRIKWTSPNVLVEWDNDL